MYSTMHSFPLTITAILRHATRVHGARKVTTSTGDGYREHTYAELGQHTAQLANALRRIGVTGDQRVATFMWNNSEHLTAYLAVPAMGAVLHTLNIRLFPEQIVYVASEAEDQVVLVDVSLVNLLAPLLADIKTVHTVIAVGDGDIAALEESGKTVLRYADVVAGESDEFDWPDIDENSAAAMCYTSGTTGNPKGVVYSHRSSYLHTMANCTGNGLSISASDCVIPIVPMFHANAWGLPYAAVGVGAKLVFYGGALEPGPFVDLLLTERVSVSAAVPTVWAGVAEELMNRPEPARDIRHIISGGSQPPRALIERYLDELGIPIVQAWGMTETSPLSSVAWPQHRMKDWPKEAITDAARRHAGLPLPGVLVRLRDGDGSQVPFDGTSMGSLEVRGPWVTDGYLHGHGADDFTRDGWFVTGDVAIGSSDGYFVIADRTKDLIKSGGEWISSVDMEVAIMAMPDVLEAAVIAVPHPKWLERPVAYVVAHPGTHVGSEEVHRHLERSGFARWQLPDRVELIDEVPKTAVGKFDKKVLRARDASS